MEKQNQESEYKQIKKIRKKLKLLTFYSQLGVILGRMEE